MPPPWRLRGLAGASGAGAPGPAVAPSARAHTRPSENSISTRIPELTADGRRVQAEVTSARDRVEAALLATFTPQEQDLLRELLARLADSDNATGSCM